MVERIMLFKLVDSSTRDETAALTLKALGGLRKLEELSVGVPADEASAKSWDLSVVMGFSNPDELAGSLESPAFRDFMHHTMEGRYEVVKAWSFVRLA
jgi:hypothetical protein